MERASGKNPFVISLLIFLPFGQKELSRVRTLKKKLKTTKNQLGNYETFLKLNINITKNINKIE